MLAEWMQGAQEPQFWDFLFEEVERKSRVPIWLYMVGFLGQAMFFSRFLVQWMVSEKHKKSVFPLAFWYLSLSGGSILFLYAFLNGDPVIMLGQAVGTFVYIRNIILRKREARATE